MLNLVIWVDVMTVMVVEAVEDIAAEAAAVVVAITVAAVVVVVVVVIVSDEVVAVVGEMIDLEAGAAVVAVVGGMAVSRVIAMVVGEAEVVATETRVVAEVAAGLIPNGMVATVDLMQRVVTDIVPEEVTISTAPSSEAMPAVVVKSGRSIGTDVFTLLCNLGEIITYNI